MKIKYYKYLHWVYATNGISWWIFFLFHKIRDEWKLIDAPRLLSCYTTEIKPEELVLMGIPLL